MVVAMVAVVGLAACGGDGRAVSDRAANQLATQVTQVRVAVEAHDAMAAAGALTTLRTSVARLVRAGDVSQERAVEILSAARAVETQLVSITTTTTTTTTTRPPPPPPAVTGDEKGGKGKPKR
jgi:hypothetical protein